MYDLSLATQGVMVSQYNTGVNYSLGFGIHLDIEKSVYWFQEATKQGHSKAPFNMAILYAKGGKVQKDLILSETYFLLASERGNKEAKKFLKSVPTSKSRTKSVISGKDSEDDDKFRLIIKCGTDGSVDAVRKVLETMENNDITLEIIHASSGSVNENDVMLASAADAVVIGFQSQIEQGAIRQSKANDVLIKNYNIVYEMIDDLNEMLIANKKGQTEEKIHGVAEVLDMFSVGKRQVAGGFRVVEGEMRRNGLIKITRGDAVVFQGSILSLRHLKENVREVKNGMEGGLTVDGFNNYEKGDLIECFEIITT